mmetsp:Transcript_12525/g.30245  ORF Transcript_12525/g.30245 Transcript_12525/m.30245 type:complete len:602 (+) Transcript_12525:200-2005(+)
MSLSPSSSSSSSSSSTNTNTACASSPSWYVSKRVILASLALIYFVAFYGAYNQNLGLMGRNGLLVVDHRPYQHFSSFVEKYYNKNNRWWFLPAFRDHPSLLWFVVAWYGYFQDDNDRGDAHISNPNFVADYVMTDQNLTIVFKSGMTLSGIVLLSVVFGTKTNNNTVHETADDPSSRVVQFMLWLLYFTVVSSCDASTSFYSYGWESQLLETGFLSIFLCESVVFPSSTRTTTVTMDGFGFFSRNRKNSDASRHRPQQPQSGEDESEQQQRSAPATNTVALLPQPRSEILWLFRWLSFRISIGAGLIKIRGDSCWTNKTCLWYHFETQPIPSPSSFIFHFLPKWTLSRAVDLDLFVQVYTSWFVLIPTSISILPGMSSQTINWFLLNVARIGGIIQIGFMINIILSGNFAFLNHLTIVPSLACLDDACWPKFCLPRVRTRQLEHGSPSLVMASSPNTNLRPANRLWNMIRPRRRTLNWLIFGLIMMLSRPVVENLLQIGGKRQKMNASFDSFRLVGSYGAFGSVGKARYEPIVQIAYETSRTNSTPTHEWIELEFPCKPGSLTRRPCFCAPYHYRLDWNIWFIGFKPHKRYLHHRESWLFD